MKKLAAMLFATAVFAAGAVFAESPDPRDPSRAGWLTFIDIHKVSSDAEAREYAEWVKPLAEKHGVELIQVYDVVSVEAGDLQGEWIYLFRSPNPETFGALLNDPEYAANIPNRDRIHDMAWVKRF
ncbi:MAG: DUF1330 domain-containing protein, partial [Pseudomonadota bacterium]